MAVRVSTVAAQRRRVLPCKPLGEPSSHHTVGNGADAACPYRRRPIVNVAAGWQARKGRHDHKAGDAIRVIRGDPETDHASK